MQYMKIIQKIQWLQQPEHYRSKNKGAIMDLYQMILEGCPDDPDIAKQSASAVELYNKKGMTIPLEKEWLNFLNNKFASNLAIKIYQNKLAVSEEELPQILDFYKNGYLYKEVLSIGLYACAQKMVRSDPMQCYQLTKDAFTMNPGLASALNIPYRYEGKAAEEHLTEACPFCGSTGEDLIPWYCSPQVVKLKNNKTFPPAKLWIKCRNCQNYFTYNFPLPSVGTINGHYTRNDSLGILKNRYPLEIYNNIFGRLREMTDGSDYLEIGVGNGEMLALALEFGYQVDAVEICKEDCERISSVLGVDVKWCDIVNYEPEKQYDVIIMGDVFEHVTDPAGVLKKVAGMLKDDGVLWLSTPNYNCAYARMQKFSHCMWHELNHYTYVSRETLEDLLRGLHMEIRHYDVSNRYIGSMELFIQKIGAPERS